MRKMPNGPSTESVHLTKSLPNNGSQLKPEPLVSD
jgi:hypothetical protein